MRRLCILVAVGMVVAACAGGGDSAAAPTASAGDTGQTEKVGNQPDTTTASATTAVEDDDESSASATATGQTHATVTIGDETYHFGDAGRVALRCAKTAGILFATLERVDENGSAHEASGLLNLEISEDNSLDRQSYVSVKFFDPEEEWIANESKIVELELAPGTSQIDDVEVEGATATGSATFYEDSSYWAFRGGSADAVQAAQGTFEITCADG